MKTHTLSSKLLAGFALALASSVAVPVSLAGPGSGVSIWRNADKNDSSVVVAPAADDNTDPRACTDARLVPITEHKWIRTGGRGPRIVEVGKRLACTSCATPTVARKTSDRNAHSPKASLPIRGTHDCGKSGCGGTIALVD